MLPAPARSAIFSFFLLLFVLPAFVQQGSARPKESSMYSKALFVSLAEMAKTWGRIDDSDGGSRVPTDYHHMLVQKEPEITEGLPEQSGQYRVEYLDTRELIARCKQLRKPFAILKIQPMKSAGTKRTIQVTVYWAEYKKSRLSLGLSDWSDVEFRFDSNRQSFVVSNITLGGI